ncbi:DUF6461 domain-containing protein [Embleya sp. MST-111070]|uniref:DUF6461 domain-containing protein n=1 Tax=Embleya sp. MST-111070 TaxID=3398231 RepID=UPI003F7342C0
MVAARQNHPLDSRASRRLQDLGADPGSARSTRREERDGPDLLSVHSLGGDWLLAFEPNGFEGFVDLLHELSVGTEVVVFNRNVLAHCRFRHVVDGATWTYFGEFELTNDPASTPTG